MLTIACLATPAAYSITPQLGGNDANLAAIDGSQFSTTTRLKGEVLFGIRELLGENDIGEAALFGASNRLRLGFDTSFTGEDALRTRFTVGGTYSENVRETIANQQDSWIYNFGGDIGARLTNGPLDVLLGLGGTINYYDEDFVGRQADENWLPELRLAVGARYKISDSAVVKLCAQGYYGGIANVSRGYIKSGVLDHNYFFWNMDLEADYRLDGGGLGDAGLEWSTAFSWNGLEEDRNGPVGNRLDNYDIEFRQEVRFNVNENATVFAAGSYGHREFGNWHPMGNPLLHADSHNYRVGGGTRVRWGDKFHWGAEAGVEFRDYDSLPAGGNDDRTEFYINGDINAQLTDKSSLGIFFDYGIQNFNINDIPIDAFLDPRGIRSGLRTLFQWNETTSLASEWTYTPSFGSDALGAAWDSFESSRWGCGLSLTHMLNDRVELAVDGDLIYLDNDLTGDDTYFTVGGRMSVGF